MGENHNQDQGSSFAHHFCNHQNKGGDADNAENADEIKFNTLSPLSSLSSSGNDRTTIPGSACPAVCLVFGSKKKDLLQHYMRG